MDTLARVKHLIGTTAEWAAHDLVAGEGEMVLEQAGAGVVKAKLGDGVSKFSALAYFGGLSTMPLGTVALPGLPFTGDADTGIYSPGANQLGFSTAGFRRLGVDGAGNWDMPRATGNPATLIVGANTLGLGLDVKAPATAAELAALRITDSTGNTARLFVQADNTKAVIGTGSLPLELWTNGTPRLSFAVGGNASFNGVSVGGIAPGTPAAPGLSFAGDPNTGIYSPGADALALATGGVARLTADAAGNVTAGSGPITTPATGAGHYLAAFNNANDGTVASNATLIAESMFRNANVQLRIGATGTGGYQWTDLAGANLGQLYMLADRSMQLQIATATGLTMAGDGAAGIASIAFLTGRPVAPRLTIDAAGLVTFAAPTATPANAAAVTINANDAAAGLEIVSATSGSAPVARMYFRTQNVRQWGIGSAVGDTFNIRDQTRLVNPIVIDGPTGKVTIAGDLVVLGTINGSTGGGGGTAGAMPPGTAALPGLPFVGDADTGFFSPGANLLSIATQGIERLRVFGDGMFHIVTPTIVADTLTVDAAVGAAALVLVQGSPAGKARMTFSASGIRNWGLGTDTGDRFTLRDATRAADVLSFDNLGNAAFGVPITTPTLTGQTLSLAGNANTGDANSNATLIIESANRNANVQIRSGPTSTSGFQWTGLDGANRGQVAMIAGDVLGLFTAGGVIRVEAAYRLGNFAIGSGGSDRWTRTKPLRSTPPVFTTAAINIVGPASGGGVARIKFAGGTATPRTWAMGTQVGDVFDLRDLTRGATVLTFDMADHGRRRPMPDSFTAAGRVRLAISGRGCGEVHRSRQHAAAESSTWTSAGAGSASRARSATTEVADWNDSGHRYRRLAHRQSFLALINGTAGQAQALLKRPY